MSFVIAVPEFVASAATDLSNISSSLTAAHAVAAAIASVFSGHAKDFQALSARAAAFHAEFVRALSGAGGAYSVAEAANAGPLQALFPLWQDVRGVINAPTDAWGCR